MLVLLRICQEVEEKTQTHTHGLACNHESIFMHSHKSSRARTQNRARSVSCASCSASVLPLTKQVDEEITLESLVQQLREEVDVRDERRLQNDGSVRRVEEFDWVGPHLATNLLMFHWQLHTKPLKEDHDEEQKGSNEQ